MCLSKFESFSSNSHLLAKVLCKEQQQQQKTIPSLALICSTHNELKFTTMNEHNWNMIPVLSSILLDKGLRQRRYTCLCTGLLPPSLQKGWGLFFCGDATHTHTLYEYVREILPALFSWLFFTPRSLGVEDVRLRGGSTHWECSESKYAVCALTRCVLTVKHKSVVIS